MLVIWRCICRHISTLRRRCEYAVRFAPRRADSSSPLYAGNNPYGNVWLEASMTETGAALDCLPNAQVNTPGTMAPTFGGSDLLVQ